MKIPKYFRTRKYYSILLLWRREWLREYFGGTVPSASAASQSLLQAKKRVHGVSCTYSILYYILPYFNIAVLVCISWVDTGLPVMIKFQKSCKSWDLWEALRMLRIFRTVWRLVYGLLTSGNAMLSTFFILLLTLYIYACLGRAYRKTMKNPGGGGHKHGRVLETFWLFEYYSVEDWVIGSIRFSAHACLHLQKHHHLVSCRCNIRMGSKKLITRWA